MSEFLFDLFIEGTPRAQGSMRHVGNGRLIHGKGMTNIVTGIVKVG